MRYSRASAETHSAQDNLKDKNAILQYIGVIRGTTVLHTSQLAPALHENIISFAGKGTSEEIMC